jgi:hypothetical protein
MQVLKKSDERSLERSLPYWMIVGGVERAFLFCPRLAAAGRDWHAAGFLLPILGTRKRDGRYGLHLAVLRAASNTGGRR